MDKYDKIEELLNTTCYVVDILPKRVEIDDEGQYFAVEKYYLEQTILEIYRYLTKTKLLL